MSGGKGYDFGLDTDITNLAMISDSDYDRLSEKHFNLQNKLSANKDFHAFESELYRSEETLLHLSIDIAGLEEKYVKKTSFVKGNKKRTTEEMVDILMDACFNKGENKKIKRLRMRLLLTEMPLTISKIDELIANIDNAFALASQKELNFFANAYFASEAE